MAQRMTRIYKAPCGSLLLELTYGMVSRCSWNISVGEVYDCNCDSDCYSNSDCDCDNTEANSCNQKVMNTVIEQLDEYFAGSRSAFDLPMLIVGTEFQRKVWDCLMKIPYGATMSYAQIALLCGCKGGQRAIAQACGSNRLNVLVPCHRVVRSDGSIGGYTITTSGINKGAQPSGVKIKQFLLNLEKQPTRQQYRN